jgi:hypothetical protein
MEIIVDCCSKERLIERFNRFKYNYLYEEELINNGYPIRHQNMPEDISENIAKFIIRKIENDNSCIWCKGYNKTLIGDLFSINLNKIIEIKSFMSDGPSQFGPGKKFDELYFLDLRNLIKNDKIILWKTNLTNLSSDFINMKVNKNETLGQQLEQKRRPHISWDKIYPQIEGNCQKIYDDSFSNIFTN